MAWFFWCNLNSIMRNPLSSARDFFSYFYFYDCRGSHLNNEHLNIPEYSGCCLLSPFVCIGIAVVLLRPKKINFNFINNSKRSQHMCQEHTESEIWQKKKNRGKVTTGQEWRPTLLPCHTYTHQSKFPLFKVSRWRFFQFLFSLSVSCSRSRDNWRSVCRVAVQTKTPFSITIHHTN